MADKRKRLTLSILQYLNSSVTDGSISSSEAESVQIAIQCISEAFGVSLDNPEDVEKFGVKGTNLMSIFDVYLKAEEKRKGATGAKTAPPEASTSTSASTPTPPPPPSAADKSLADSHKSSGNALMAAKDYNGAIDAYTKAIDKDPTNPVYYSNRAAAYSQISDHESAIADALKASEVDPKFSKAYSRLGHAYFSSGKYQDAVQAYEKGLELDPANQVMKNSLATARQKLNQTKEEDEINADDDESSNPLTNGSNSNPFAGLGGGGGMPNLANLMNNPMVMQMAQQMMANGGLEQLMNNPALRNMAESFGRGGGMPDFNALMNDPTLRNMAEQFGQGMGRGRGSGN